MEAKQTVKSSSYAKLLEKMRLLGIQQWYYGTEVINSIATDNAKPPSFLLQPLYRGDLIQEGLKEQRPCAGTALHDEIETLAEEAACTVFDAEHANLQPDSCSQANQAVYHAFLSPSDVALYFKASAHLTRGFSAGYHDCA